MASESARSKPLRLALLGAGIFARDAHLPALQRLTDQLELVAIYSRTLAAADRLAARWNAPLSTTANVDELLARDDIEAVDILLPIDVMPRYVERALRAGKHVISEKPIAPDVATGRGLLARYRADHAPALHWSVGENWRYEPAFVRAAELVARGDLGRPLLFDWFLQIPIDERSKYYHSAWRRSGAVPGGFVLDCGVHHIAALRAILGEVIDVEGCTAHVRDDLPSSDAVAATLRLSSGAIGTYGATYAAASSFDGALRIVCERGCLRVDRGWVEHTSGGSTERETHPSHVGVLEELSTFARALRDGQGDRNTPEQALADLAVIEAVLASSAAGTRATPGYRARS